MTTKPTEAEACPPRPLSAAEEGAWRSFVRAMVVVPRVLDRELQESQGLTLAEYSALMRLSEAPDRSMRMGDLASSVDLTTGGMTRVVERLDRRGLVRRVRAESDKRGQVAMLTDTGLARLQQAWPTHLAGVRRHVMDHLADLDLDALADALRHVARAEVSMGLHRTIPPTGTDGAASAR